jgi:uncharacterized protein (DUF1697 family)
LTTYIALLRAVNVGGTGKLPMPQLKALCAKLGFQRVETYIASGNVIFDCDWPAAKVQTQLEKQLQNHVGKAVDTFVRTAAEMKAVLEKNPFSQQEPRLTYAFFLHERPPPDAVTQVRGRADEEIYLGTREIYVFYPTGMGQSKLKIPAAIAGTARNLNTVAKLVAMSSRRGEGGL